MLHVTAFTWLEAAAGDAPGVITLSITESITELIDASRLDGGKQLMTEEGPGVAEPPNEELGDEKDALLGDRCTTAAIIADW